MSFKKKGKKGLRRLVILLLSVCILGGCKKEAKEEVEYLDFTVLAPEEIPDPFLLMIAERQEAPFQLSYQDGTLLYLAVGYGLQQSGGYSIQVPAFYTDGETMVLDTTLIGPESTPTGGDIAKSCPYIVIMTQYRDLPVVYE